VFDVSSWVEDIGTGYLVMEEEVGRRVFQKSFGCPFS
jgi:hypothetical protein